jgi:hypothetical protein
MIMVITMMLLMTAINTLLELTICFIKNYKELQFELTSKLLISLWGFFICLFISHVQVLLQQKIPVFPDVTLCCCVSGSQHLKATRRLHLQGFEVTWNLEPLKMKAKYSFHMLGTTHPGLQQHISKDCTAQVHNCENLKTRVLLSLTFYNIYQQDTKLYVHYLLP